MSGVWIPKKKHWCPKCGWTGMRGRIRACPRCGFWHPRPEPK